MTAELPHVERVKRLGDYRLKLWWNDGQAGVWDFSELARRPPGPLVDAFRDPAYFDRVFVEQGALSWPNGYDWSPVALYTEMARAGVLSSEPFAA